MGCSEVGNLLEPTDTPHTNHRFLATVAIICEALNRHGGSLRTAIATHSNDHRLGANEAPPSIISAFLGDTLTAILEAYAAGKAYEATDAGFLDLGADQLARLVKDNTDRNRTSPFAFTGNKFESSQNVGVPLTILNAAVADVFNDVNVTIEKEKAAGKKVEDILIEITKDLYNNSKKVVFNGDGYSKEWEEEAKKRGLPNMRTSADALKLIGNLEASKFLLNLGVYSENELKMRYNVRVERYCKHREIEFRTLINLINKDILPATIEYKGVLAAAIDDQKDVDIDPKVDIALLKKINDKVTALYEKTETLAAGTETLGEEIKDAEKIANELLPLSEEIAEIINFLEENVAEDLWPLPTYYDLLFVR